MQQAGKQSRQQQGATSVAGPTQSRLFYVTHRASVLKFLIDTDAEVSVVPHSHTHWKTQEVPACKPLTIIQFLQYQPDARYKSNAFIASSEHVYRYQQMRLLLDAYAFIAEGKRV